MNMTQEFSSSESETGLEILRSQFLTWAEQHLSLCESLSRSENAVIPVEVFEKISHSLLVGKNIYGVLSTERIVYGQRKVPLPLSGFNRFSAVGVSSSCEGAISPPKEPNRHQMRPLPSKTYLKKNCK